MKNRIKPIDVNIVSGYLGRFQTAIVALLVIAITGHAFVTRNTARGHVTLTIAVPAAADRFEPFARIVARESSRTVELAAGQWSDAAELFVMPPGEFFALRESLGLDALFGLCQAPTDRAVIIGGRADTAAPTSATDVLFTAPASVNGCWIQLHALSRREARVPASLDSLRFTRGEDGARVVWAVQNRVARFGACRASELEESDLEQLRVVFQTPALPDLIVASRADDRGYFMDCLGGLPAMFDAPGDDDRDEVELMQARGIGAVRGVSGAQLAELESVCEFARTLSGAR